jgi:hypothetical protein
VEVSGGRAVGHLGVLLLALQVLVVVYEVVPAHRLILGRLQLQGGHLELGRVALVVTRFEQQHLVSCNGQTGGQGTATRAGANHHIVILGGGVGHVPRVKPLVAIVMAAVEVNTCQQLPNEGRPKERRCLRGNHRGQQRK